MARDELKWTIRIARAEGEAVAAAAAAQGRSLNDYVIRAVRTQILIDASGMEWNTATRLIRDATEPLSRAANFAAIHAAAALLLVKELMRAAKQAEGMPEALVREQVDVLVESALDEAAAIFADPRTQVAYGWIERPLSEDDLPAWVRVIDEDADGEEPEGP
jgi:hypothetical protein